MGRYELEYPKEPFSTVKRHNERASYALEAIHGIINASRMLYISFSPPGSPFPVTLPMMGQMGSFARPSADTGDVLDLYVHGYVTSRMMNVARDSEESKGMPVCVAASHFDGLVLALTPFQHSYNYRSAVLFGHATLVSDPAEKLWALELITDGTVPGRWADSRVPPTAGEMQSTSVLKIAISHGSAKFRTGNTEEERADLQDAALTGRVWAGVVPVYETFGEPVPAPTNRVAEMPAYLREYLRDCNDAAKEYAVGATVAQTVIKKKDEEEEE